HGGSTQAAEIRSLKNSSVFYVPRVVTTASRGFGSMRGRFFDMPQKQHSCDLAHRTRLDVDLPCIIGIRFAGGTPGFTIGDPTYQTMFVCAKFHYYPLIAGNNTRPDQSVSLVINRPKCLLIDQLAAGCQKWKTYVGGKCTGSIRGCELPKHDTRHQIG